MMNITDSTRHVDLAYAVEGLDTRDEVIAHARSWVRDDLGIVNEHVNITVLTMTGAGGWPKVRFTAYHGVIAEIVYAYDAQADA